MAEPFDLFAQQQLILGQLASLATAAGVAIEGTFGLVNLTDDAAPPIAAQTVFMRLAQTDESGRSAKYAALWSFDLYVDAGRASPAQKAAAAALFSGALGALIGWEFDPDRMRRVSGAPGQESGFQGHITRISFGFSIPVYLAG